MEPDTDSPSNRKEIFMKKSIYLMAVSGCVFALVSGCGSRKEAVLLESAVSQEGTVSDDTALNAADSEGAGGDWMSSADASGFGDSGGTAGDAENDTVFVYICGAVTNPGVYEMDSGSRICDVLDQAGGFSEDASTTYLNLAEFVSDGQKVYVPTQEELTVELFAEEDAAEAGSGKININTASKEVLVTLPGIGESKADSIIAYRTEHGGFSSIEEIMEIPGIKEAVFSKIKELITVD
jgi:competence protein ComEA